MEPWIKISLLLCGYGFLREIRPSEPFVTDYLMQPWRNVTSDEVNRYVYPVGTYSYAAQLVLIFLLTDYLRYKPIIVLSSIAGIIAWSMLVWTKSLQSLQILEIFYGTYMATEVGYYTYIYAKVSKKFYLKITSHARAAVLLGRFLAGSSGQLFVYTKWADYRDLHAITLGAQILSFIWAVFLPSVKTSQYFHRRRETNGVAGQQQQQQLQHQSPNQQQTALESANETTDETIGEFAPLNESKTIVIRDAIRLIQKHLINSYTNTTVVLWSVWYAAALCGYLQVCSYIQVLWSAIDNSEEMIWNGAVEASIALIGATVSLIAGCIRLKQWSKQKKIWFLLLLSFGQGLSILWTAGSSTRLLSYFGYMIFYTLYSFTVTVASAEIAQHIEDDSFGLVFGLNTLIALIMQTLLTLIVVSDNFYLFTIFEQYSIYCYYFISLSICYLIAVVYFAIDGCID